MSIAPLHEQSLFSNRDKFDLVVVYDEASTDYGTRDSPLSVLVRLISEQAIQKMLKRMPMLLVGGMLAWRHDIGDTEVVQGGMSSFDPQKNSFPENPPSKSPSLSSSPNSRNPFLTNTLALTASTSSITPSPSDPHQVWTPRPRIDGPIPSTDMRSPPQEHRMNFSLEQHSGHSRLVADASYRAINANIPTDLPQRLLILLIFHRLIVPLHAGPPYHGQVQAPYLIRVAAIM